MSTIWDGEYGYDAYREILNYLKLNFSLNYLIREIPQILSQIHRPKFIIRHDVTTAPEKALVMAELESGMAVASTYLFCTDASDYEYDAGDTPGIIDGIRGLGHEVGLHYAIDPAEGSRGPTPAFIDKDIRARCGKLESVTRGPVFSVSLNDSSLKSPGRSLFLGSKVNAAAPMMMEWHLVDTDPPWKMDAIAPRPARPYEALLQLVIHPHLWG